MSASWCLVETWNVFTVLSWIFSLTKWHSNSMCFVLSWYIGLVAMWIAAWLSQQRRAGWSWLMVKSFGKPTNHTNSLTKVAIVLYSNSAEDLEPVCCFLDLQEISDSPKNTQYPVIDLLVWTQREVATLFLQWSRNHEYSILSGKDLSSYYQRYGFGVKVQSWKGARHPKPPNSKVGFLSSGLMSLPY